jgi:hypothetical protein
MQKNPIEYVTLRSPEGFLGALHAKHWAEGGWVFRGHADAEWKLLPAAYRADTWSKTGWVELPNQLHSEKQRSETELSLLLLFAEHMDEAGFAIPDRTHELLDQTVAQVFTGIGPQWIQEHRALASLAQHFGLPTRLLDVSRRGHVAAYFAAREHSSGNATDMCVWAIRQQFLDIGVRTPDAWFKLLSAPRSSNSNLHAQSGAFVAWSSETLMDLEQLVTGVCSGKIPLASGKLDIKFPVMKKLTLRRKHAAELSRLLRLEGITSMSMFPGIDGVVRAVRERINEMSPQPRPRRKRRASPGPSTGA